MPHSMFSVKEVSTYLHLRQDDIELLVKRREIPCTVQGGRTLFRRSEVDAWASQRILKLREQPLADYHSRSSAGLRSMDREDLLMAGLLTADRIAPALTSRTRASILRDMVRLAAQTDLVSDPEDLLRMIEEREQMCSTGLAGGWALLHPRHHDPYMFADSFIVVGRTIQPIFFGADDGAPTDLFFLVCCQDDRLHLHTLARLCTMSAQTGLLAALRSGETPEAMLAALCTAEKDVVRHL